MTIFQFTKNHITTEKATVSDNILFEKTLVMFKFQNL